MHNIHDGFQLFLWRTMDMLDFALVWLWRIMDMVDANPKSIWICTVAYTTEFGLDEVFRIKSQEADFCYFAIHVAIA